MKDQTERLQMRLDPQTKAIGEAEAARLGMGLSELVRLLLRLSPAIGDVGRINFAEHEAHDADVIVFDASMPFHFVTRDLRVLFMPGDEFDVIGSRFKFDDLGRAIYFDVARVKDDREDGGGWTR